MKCFVRYYDNKGETFDRYTAVYEYENGECDYFGMSEHPMHPQGFGQHGGGGDMPIDWPTSAHLGRRISYQDLPEDCQQAISQDLEGFVIVNQ